MLRFTIAALTMFAVAPAALACGGQPCGENCAMKNHHDGDHAKVDVAHAEGTKVAFKVEGMKCGACADKITAALTKVDGVNAVAVNAETGKAEIAFDGKKTDEKALIGAISSAGSFKAAPAKKEG